MEERRYWGTWTNSAVEGGFSIREGPGKLQVVSATDEIAEISRKIAVQFHGEGRSARSWGVEHDGDSFDLVTDSGITEASASCSEDRNRFLSRNQPQFLTLTGNKGALGLQVRRTSSNWLVRPALLGGRVDETRVGLLTSGSGEPDAEVTLSYHREGSWSTYENVFTGKFAGRVVARTPVPPTILLLALVATAGSWRHKIPRTGTWRVHKTPGG